MSDRPDDERREDNADADDMADDASSETRALPSIDPREEAQPDAPLEPPPVDIDERDLGVSHADPPEVIELPDHGGEPEDEPVPPEHPVDDGSQPLPPDSEANVESSALDSPDTDPDRIGSAPGPEPEAEDQQWVPPDASVYGDAHEPAAEPMSTAATTPIVEEEGFAGATSLSADEADDNETEPEERKGDGSSDAPSKGARFLGSFGAATSSARSTVTAKVPWLIENADEKSGTGARGDGGFLGMFSGNSGELLDPTLHAVTTLPHRMVLIGGAIAILLSLLSNNAGLALIVASAIVPVWIALTLHQQDLFEKESSLLTTAVGAAGLVIGAIVSLLSSWLVNSNWFDNGVLNYGAAGLGGRFADLAGTAPFVVWFFCGLLLPLLALGAIVAVPIAMRRWPQFRNEVMDGVILCGTSAAGFAIGSAMVFWAPMVSENGPQTSVSEWTLTTLGVVLLRPIVITLAGAMLGAGVWKYMLTPTPGVVLLPALGSIGGFLLLSFGSLQLQPSGLWPEVVWTLLIAIVSFLVYRLVLNSAISADRKVVGDDQARVVCPSCRKITPAGSFCAHCGAVLEQDPAPAV